MNKEPPYNTRGAEKQQQKILSVDKTTIFFRNKLLYKKTICTDSFYLNYVKCKLKSGTIFA